MAEPTVAPGVYDAYRLRAGPDESQINEPKFMKQQINEQQINEQQINEQQIMNNRLMLAALKRLNCQQLLC